MSFYNTENWPEKSRYYRWPWSGNDNPVGWLEATDLCNMRCRGCYRSRMEGHRKLETLKSEVDFLIRLRNIDTVCIAGGEPLLHPGIVELVRYISGRGLKSNIITNTLNLSEKLLGELCRAGVFGFTCHIDMLQDRPGVNKGATEIDLMPLRGRVADLLWNVSRGKIYCTLNMTVFHENFKYIPDIVRWARGRPDRVHGLDFITYRGMPLADHVSWEGGTPGGESREEIKRELSYSETDVSRIDITSVDVYNLLKDNFGDQYEPCAYLGGTGNVRDYRWWGEVAIMEKDGTVYGSIGPRTMEFIQMVHHWFRGRYFMYLRRNRLSRFLFHLTGLIGDRNLKKARRRAFPRLLNPWNWFRPLYYQSIGINQPPDMMENGMASMCESCPDACVFEGNLVSSCRLDEYRKYGRLLNAVLYHPEKPENTDRSRGPGAEAVPGGPEDRVAGTKF